MGGWGGGWLSYTLCIWESKLVCEIWLLSQPLPWSSTILKWIFLCMTAWFLIRFETTPGFHPYYHTATLRFAHASPCITPETGVTMARVASPPKFCECVVYSRRARGAPFPRRRRRHSAWPLGSSSSCQQKAQPWWADVLSQTSGRTTLAPVRAETCWLVPGKQVYTEYHKRPRPLYRKL
jgi:hypothetical protein